MDGQPVFVNGYEYITDSNSGALIAVDTVSGEVLDTMCIYVPEGSTIWTPKQKERYRCQKAVEKETEERERLRELQKVSMPFYFARCTERIKLKPETATRLFYLMAFAGHKENGRRLLINNRTPMQKKDLPNILKVDRKTVTAFFAEVSPQFIQEDESGLLWTESTWFYRGKGLQMSEDEAYTRIFCDCMKKLYNGAHGKGLKYLGYVFQMLPYVNREYNVICSNPKEKDVQKICKLNLLDVCGILGFNENHVDRFARMLAAQTFEIDGCEEGFFRLLTQPNSMNYKTADIYINPNLLYAGTDFSKVDFLLATPKRREILTQQSKGLDSQRV